MEIEVYIVKKKIKRLGKGKNKMTNIQKILLIVGIIIFIVALDIGLCKNTDNLVDDTLVELEKIKAFLVEENFDESKKRSEALNKKWFEYEDKLSFYIEHDELEKVSSKIAIILENTINKDYKPALEDVMETTYLLEHVKDKNKLKLKNIF